MVVQKEVPLVHFRAVVPAGVRQDSNANAGLSELTANLLSSGTASYDKETIETTLDFMGASYNSSSNMEASVLTSSFINKDLPSMFFLFLQKCLQSHHSKKQSL
jgi:predicted Zn-dependent peptidase